MGGINNRLAQFRKEANFSQEEFADRIGVRRETILRVENGKYYPQPPSGKGHISGTRKEHRGYILS